MTERKNIKGAEALLLSLLEEGVDTIFGYPGGAIMPLYDDLYDYADRIEYYSIKDNHIRPLFAMGSRKDQSELKDYDDLMAYYLSVVSQSGYFYCLKSTSGTERGNLIEVYDSEGKAVACHMLDKEVSSVRFDSEGNLVGYVPDINQTLLYQFRLDN